MKPQSLLQMGVILGITCKEFEGYEVSLDDSNEFYRFVRREFEGNAEKFYP